MSSTVTKRAAKKSATLAGRKSAKAAAKHPVKATKVARTGATIGAKGVATGVRARSTVRSLRGQKSTTQQIAPYAIAGGVVVVVVVTVVAVRRRRTEDAEAGGSREFGTPAEGTESAKSSGDDERPNDPTLARKVEQAIFEVVPEAKGQVNVNAENGVVYLRGQIDSEGDMNRLAGAAGGVEGVESVKNLLHTPSNPAPTKDS